MVGTTLCQVLQDTHSLFSFCRRLCVCVCVCVYVGKTDIVNIYYMYIVAGVARSQALPVTLLHTGESLGTRLLQVCMKLIA